MELLLLLWLPRLGTGGRQRRQVNKAVVATAGVGAWGRGRLKRPLHRRPVVSDTGRANKWWGGIWQPVTAG